MEVISMDAIGLSNYTAMNGIKPQEKPSNSTPVAGASTPKTGLGKPIVDTVDISAPATQQAPQEVVFDPTAATNGTYAQKHVCGQLATSSAIDGYDGWAAMLKYCFGMTKNLDRTDMAVIPHFNSLDYSVDGYGPAAGYIAANALTHQQRNLIANIFVYAHDHGMSERGAAGSLASAMIDIATHGASSTRIEEYDDVLSLAQQAADTREDIDGVSHRDVLVDSIRRYGFSTGNNSARDDAEALQRDEVALRTLSSAAIKDNLISEHAINWCFVTDWYGEDNRSLTQYQDLEKLVHAYSRTPNTDDGKLVEMSPLAQRYLNWRKGEVAARHSLEAEAKEPPKKDLIDIQARNVINGTFSMDGGPSGKTRDVAEEMVRYYEGRVGKYPQLHEDWQLELWKRIVEIKHEEARAEASSPQAAFDKYSSRISALTSSLSGDQKSVLTQMYKLAEEKGDEASFRKVDALANAFASNNTLSILFTPGKDNDGKTTTNLLDMMQIHPENKEKPQVQAEILTKKYNDALAAIQNNLFKPASPTKPETKPGIEPPTQG